MPKRRDDYDGYDDYGYYPASRPRKAADGIKAKTTRGKFGESWWAKRWINVLESYGIGSRLQRGRSYARQGQVLDVNIEPGTVTARVQGSAPRPYKVNIALPLLSDGEWDRAIKAMSEQAIFAAKLLAGEMPNEIEEAFKTANVSLFPKQGRELKTSCSCPDYANPCKHIAAVYYLLGEQFDVDPFLIFTLRGRTREQIIEALRKLRSASVPESAVEPELILPPVPALSEQLDQFWETGDLSSIQIHVEAPTVKFAVLRRLGEPPAGTQHALEALYKAGSEFALKKVFGEG